jgi:hypothetical protein
MKYQIIGNTLSEKLANASELKNLLSVFNEPYNFIINMLLNESISSYNEKLYLNDVKSGTLTDYDFLQHENFKKALRLVNRKIKPLRTRVIISKPN